MGPNWRMQLLLAAFLVATTSIASATLNVEHSFDGSNFLPAGRLVGDVLSVAELSWQRPELTKGDLESLEQAVNSKGVYSVRVHTDKGILLTSTPAACLLLPKFKEQVELHATRDGEVVAFNYEVPACRSRGAVVAGGGSSSSGDDEEAGGFAARPPEVAVRVVMPKPGPMLSVPEVIGEFVDISVDAADMGASGGVGYDPNAKPRAPSAAQQGAGARKGGPPQPDDRTWLQKNWLFIVAGGMMVLNVLAKANAPPAQGGPAGAGGAGGGGAARRG